MDGYVLLIEDDREVRATIALVLQNFRIHVAPVGSCKQAERWLDYFAPPTVALVDYYLDGGNCEEYIRKLRQQFPYVPVVLISADAHPEILAERVRADACLAKPYTVNELVGTIERVASDWHGKRPAQQIVAAS